MDVTSEELLAAKLIAAVSLLILIRQQTHCGSGDVGDVVGVVVVVLGGDVGDVVGMVVPGSRVSPVLRKPIVPTL